MMGPKPAYQLVYTQAWAAIHNLWEAHSWIPADTVLLALATLIDDIVGDIDPELQERSRQRILPLIQGIPEVEPVPQPAETA
jgi:hypothetical protein